MTQSLVKLGHQLRVYCKPSGSPWLKAVKESGADHVLGEIGNFLEKCYFCQKRLRQQDAAFMYGSLHAFFTPECRDKQIAVDKVVAKHNQEEQGMNATGGMM
ncbi:hypothetical protein LWI29_019261 [Acer saccharum]|uniref:FLZ-type domain-containing protein n=1 Tax=Acer saccharum TaxID=4024 RepID=A0AA39SUI6_ACESA|nr:hypothetical protein LWI29_019261 [Acer saccharum]